MATDTTELVNVIVHSNGNPVEGVDDLLLALKINHAINKIPEAEIRLVDGSVADEDFKFSEGTAFLPGAKLSIQLGYGDSSTKVFEGLVVAQSLEIETQDGPCLVVRCRDEALKMTMGRRSEVFEGKGIEEVLAKYGVASAGGGTTVAQTVQAFSSDWDFLVSSAESIGQIVTCNAGTIKVSSPETSASGAATIQYGEDMLAFNGSFDATDQYKGVKAKSWDYGTQSMREATAPEPTVPHPGNVENSALAEVASPVPIELFSTTALEADALKQWAEGRLKRSRLARFNGSVRVFGDAQYTPNTWVELAGLGQRFNGPAYVSSVEHSVEANVWHSTLTLGLGSRPFVELVDATAPPAAGLLPAVHGLYNATVKKIVEDPDGQHRVQVAVPAFAADQGPGDLWARWTQPYASASCGICFPPEINDEVILGFLNADPRFPIILGGVYSSKNPPPTEIKGENPNKVIVTRSKLKIRFDDEKKLISIETPGGNKFTLDDDQKEVRIDDQHSNSIVMSKDGIVVKSAGDLTLQAAKGAKLKGMTVELEATQDLTLKGTNAKLESTASTNIKGTTGLELSGLSIKASADVSLEVSGGATGKISAGADLSLMAALIRLN